VIRIEALAVRAGSFEVRDISFEVPTGAYGVLMGKTGTGKTTILEAIAGLKPILAGRIVLGERDVTARKPAERNLGYVPQDGALFSTMPVREQLAFALSIRKASRDEIDRTVTELALLLEIRPLLDRTPLGLSGGEQQRVALGRALAFHPSTLCMDEPLSALDEETREGMYALLEHIRERTGVTVLHVTHNLSEARRLADTVLLLDAGTIRQVRPDALTKPPTARSSKDRENTPTPIS
jgi:ABC-type sugar transport system ATPase subunit